MTRPIASTASGYASGHRSPRRKEPERNNADIRPWIHAGEAAQLALSKIVKAMNAKDASQ